MKLHLTLTRWLVSALAALMVLGALSAHASGPATMLDSPKIDLGNKASLQRGAKNFVNYCLHCHQAGLMRYKTLEDIGLTGEQIKTNLLFDPAAKLSDPMTSVLAVKDAKEWFGGVPPDLSVISRVRGPDWLYTYMRTFYRDDTKPTGWNNRLYPGVGMPHVLHDLQGTQRAVYEEQDNHGIKEKVLTRLELERPGSLTPIEYDLFANDLVNYLVWMGEPSRAYRGNIGVVVLVFLGFLFMLVLWLKTEYWKDVK